MAGRGELQKKHFEEYKQIDQEYRNWQAILKVWLKSETTFSCSGVSLHGYNLFQWC